MARISGIDLPREKRIDIGLTSIYGIGRNLSKMVLDKAGVAPETRVKDLTGGKGVDVVMDSVGKATWDGSLDCLRPMGIMVTFGNASGKPDPVDPQILAGKGSLYLTRPTLFTHIASREDCQARADDLFDMVGSGKVKIEINQTYPLAEIAQAHKDLEARKTTGTTIIKP